MVQSGPLRFTDSIELEPDVVYTLGLLPFGSIDKWLVVSA
jgi:hypothetical protein